MSYRVVITARAVADAVQPFRWIAQQSPDAAARWDAGLEKAIAMLTEMPQRCPVAQDESDQLNVTLRQMLYGRRGVYRILFSIEGDTVTVHYVQHSARGSVED